MAKQAKGLPNKMKALVYSEDRAGQLLWNVLNPALVYSAQLLGDIADDIVAIDQAMKWGFGWSTGPFETWDAIGVEKSVARLGSGRHHRSAMGKGYARQGNHFFL